MRLETKLLSVGAVLALLFTFGAQSSPATVPNLAPKAAALGLSGKLFFHRYVEYGDWASKGFELDLATGRLVRIDTEWTSAKSPLNFHPNKAGTSLTFMGTQTGLDENEWDVFVTHWDGSKWADPINLTGPNEKRDEDPKFSPNGHTITYKENGVLATIEIDGSEKTYLTVGKPESSMSYFTSDGLSLIFERSGSIWKRQQDGTESKLWKARAGSTAYYPINVNSQKFLFTQVQASRHDRLMFGYYNGDPAKPLFFGSNDCDNSDAYPYKQAKRFVFAVSTCPYAFDKVFKGGYNVIMADLKYKKIYSMDAFNRRVNTDNLELGPAWSSTAPIPE